MPAEKLVHMANQIGKFFAAQGEEKAIAGIHDHLCKFWSPPMRAEILGILDQGGANLDPLTRAAVERLREAPR